MSFQGKTMDLDDVCAHWSLRAMKEHENSMMRAISAFWFAVKTKDYATLAKHGAKNRVKDHNLTLKLGCDDPIIKQTPGEMTMYHIDATEITITICLVLFLVGIMVLPD